MNYNMYNARWVEILFEVILWLQNVADKKLFSWNQIYFPHLCLYYYNRFEKKKCMPIQSERFNYSISFHLEKTISFYQISLPYRFFCRYFPFETFSQPYSLNNDKPRPKAIVLYVYSTLIYKSVWISIVTSNTTSK